MANHEQVTLLKVGDIDLNRQFFSNLGFQINDTNPMQFNARFNNQIFIVNRPQDMENKKAVASETKKGLGVEFWFQVDDVSNLFMQVANEPSAEIISNLSPGKHGSKGEFGVASPDGFQIYFYQS